MPQYVFPSVDAWVGAGQLYPPGPAIYTKPHIPPPPPPFNGNVGAGAIAGVASLAGGGFASLAVLHLAGGRMVSSTIPSSATGAYSFAELAPGHYVVSLFDASGTYKSETLHTLVP